MAAWSRFALPDSDCESDLDSDGSEGSHDEDSSSDEELDDEWAISEILGEAFPVLATPDHQPGHPPPPVWFPCRIQRGN